VKDNGYTDLFSDYTGEEGDLIPLLQKVQVKFGYISEESVQHISKFLRISENKVFGVASFYSQFRFIPPGRHTVNVCLGTACHVKGGQNLSDAVQRELGIKPGETTSDGRFDFQPVACLGCCALAPVVKVDNVIYSNVTTSKLKEILENYE
jgi:NADH-quinone oxidoreductase subunit E